MLRHYFMAAVKNLVRYKQYAIINVGGMALGIACAVLAILYANFELSFEKWIPDNDRIYRLESFYHFPGAGSSTTAAAGGPTAEAAAGFFPEIEAVTRELPFGSAAIRVGEDQFQEDVTFVDPNYLEFFPLTLLRGDRGTALESLNTVLLSERTALKYFGADDPIGRIVTFANVKDMEVVGVFRNLPSNTHLALDFITRFDEQLISDQFGVENVADPWNLPAFFTYLRLFPEARAASIESRLEAFTNANYVHPNSARRDMTPSEFVHFGIRPIKDVHLFSPHPNELKPKGSIGAVVGSIAVATLVLIIAVINYVSLSTATATLRTREISLRKVMGAQKSDIRAQFLGEALIVSLIATTAAIAVVELLLPWVIAFLNLEPGSLSIWDDPVALSLSLTVGPLAGLLSGFYPAFYLANVQPAKVLGSSRSEGRATSWIRNILVTLQFSISIGLLIAVAVFAQQTQYVSTIDMGIIRDNVSIVRIPSLAAQEAIPTLVEEFRSIPGVVSVSGSSSVPTDGLPISTSVEIPGRESEDALSAYFAAVEPEFFATYGLTPIAGRLFSEEYAKDRVSVTAADEELPGFNVIINEAAVPFLGHNQPEDALGMQFRMYTSGRDRRKAMATIVGVIPYFQFGSAYDNIRPTFFLDRPDNFFAISIRANQAAIADIRDAVEKIWQERLPDSPFQLDILNALVEAQYTAIDRQRSSLFVLALLAVLISSLGLFGMATFSVERRTKEIGIRKVLGARVQDIVQLLLFQFSRPIIVANLIAWPVSFYLMRDWLQGFAYRIDMTFAPYAGAAVLVLLIAWATVGGHAWRVARTNPIHALRYE